MAKNACRAKNPAECKFHGNRSLFHTRVLKDKLKIAHEVYKASKTCDRSTQFQAYQKLREAEMQYYATEEGSMHLSSLIEVTEDSSHKTLYIELQQRSATYRAEEEALVLKETLPSSTSYQKLPAPKTMLNSTINGETVHVLSEGNTKSGDSFDIVWNERTGTIVYGEQSDVENTAFLGNADSLETAYKKAAKWFEKAKI